MAAAGAAATGGGAGGALVGCAGLGPGRRRRGRARALDLGLQVAAELADQMVGELADHAGAAAILRDGAGQRQRGGDVDAGLGRRRRRQPELHLRAAAAAALGVARLGLDGGGVGGGVDSGDLGAALHGEQHGTEAHRDLALVAVLAGDLLEPGAGQAGCDARHVEQHGPGLVDRQRNGEAVVDLHGGSRGTGGEGCLRSTCRARLPGGAACA
ncbi:MAG: hypothetical protein U1E53_32045 [Dongiaceae bacterium]